MIKTQFTLYLVNQPGELARATRAFATARINIEGISVAAGTDVSLVQIIVSNAQATRRALKKAGIPLSEQKVAVLSLVNKPGELEKVASNLAKRNVNINYLYATVPPLGPGTRGSVVISADDLNKVERSWSE